MAIGRIVSKAGHQVIAVKHGQEGLARAKAARPELILLDMMLPTLEGTAILDRLK